MCVLYPPRIIAVACYVLAQQYVEGVNSPSLSARLASPAPSASLPTPPSNKVPYPEAMRFAIEFCNLNETELVAVAGQSMRFWPLIHGITPVRPVFCFLSPIRRINNTVGILRCTRPKRNGVSVKPCKRQFSRGSVSFKLYIEKCQQISPPDTSSARSKLYQPFTQLAQGLQKPPEPGPEGEQTSSAQAQSSPSKTPSEGTPNPNKSNGWIPVRSDPPAPDLPEKPKWQI